MALTTTDSLVADALFRAGEPTQGSSDYQTQVLQYLNDVQDVLVMGGTLGARDIAQSAGLYAPMVQVPVVDWPWLRKNPRGVFNTTAGLQGTTLGTVTVTQGSTTVTFQTGPTVSVAGWRLQLQLGGTGIPGIPMTVPRIATHTAGATTATLDVAWPEGTQTVSVYNLFPIEYPLAADFVRLAGAPVVHAQGIGATPPIVDVAMSNEAMEDEWPLPVIEQGVPTAAAFLDHQTLQFNRWDTKSYRIEYPYISLPAVLVTGSAQIPVVPTRYLTLFSVGAAMLVCQDKADAKAMQLSSEFREWLSRMGSEYRKGGAVASETFGTFLYRGRGRRNDGRLVRTSSGQIIY